MLDKPFYRQGWLLVAALASAGCTASAGPSDMAAAVTAGAGASIAGGTGGVAGASGSAGSQAATGGNSGGGAAGTATAVNTQGAAGSTGAAGASPVDAGPSGAGAGSTSGGSGAAAGSGGAGGQAAGGGGASGAPAVALEHFSFFVTSYAAIQRLSGSVDGFGGDLRYGEADGLAGADKICTEIAETSMPGSGAKGWRAFLSVTRGPDGQPIHAKSRVGAGPWYDRVGRLVAMNLDDLLQGRPRGADPVIANDLPNEEGVPNHAPDGMEQVDNHDILTGTNAQGELFSDDPGFTCKDWTSVVGSDGTPRVGHSWPRMGGGGPGGGPPGGQPPGGGFPGGGPPPDLGEDFDPANWMSSLNEAGCAPGASLIEMGPPNPDIPTVGSGGGYGGIYCFALMP